MRIHRRLLSAALTTALVVAVGATPSAAADPGCTEPPAVVVTEAPEVDGNLLRLEATIETCAGESPAVRASWAVERTDTGDAVATGPSDYRPFAIRAELPRVADRTYDLVLRLTLDEPLDGDASEARELVSEPFRVTTHALGLVPVAELVAHDVEAGTSTVRVVGGPAHPNLWQRRFRAHASGSIVVVHDGVTYGPLPFVPAEDVEELPVATVSLPGLLTHGAAEIRVRYEGDGIFRPYDHVVPVVERPARIELDVDQDAVVHHADGTVDIRGTVVADRRLTPLPRDLVVGLAFPRTGTPHTVVDAVSAAGRPFGTSRTEWDWAVDGIDVGIDPLEPGSYAVEVELPASGPYGYRGVWATVVVPLLTRTVTASARSTTSPGAALEVAARVGMPGGQPCPDEIAAHLRSRPRGATGWGTAAGGIQPVTVTPAGCRISFTVTGASTSREYRVVLESHPQEYASVSSDVVTVHTRRTVAVSARRTASTYRLTASPRPSARLLLQRQAPDGRWTTVQSTATPRATWTFVVPRAAVDRRYRVYTTQDGRGTKAASRVVVVPAATG